MTVAEKLTAASEGNNQKVKERQRELRCLAHEREDLGWVTVTVVFK